MLLAGEAARRLHRKLWAWVRVLAWAAGLQSRSKWLKGQLGQPGVLRQVCCSRLKVVAKFRAKPGCSGVSAGGLTAQTRAQAAGPSLK